MRLAFIIFILVLTLSLAGFFANRMDPSELQARLEQYAREKTSLTVRMERVKVLWGFPLKLKAENIEFLAPGDDTVIVGIPAVLGELTLRPLVERKLIFRSIQINHADIRLRRDANGVWNWKGNKAATYRDERPAGAKINPDSLANPKGSFDSWDVEIFHCHMMSGILLFEDRSAKPETALSWKMDGMDAWWRPDQEALEVKGSMRLGEENLADFAVTATFYPAGQTAFLNLDYDRGKVLLEGEVALTETLPQFRGRLKVHQWSLDRLIPESVKGGEYVTGILTASCEGHFRGIHPSMIWKTAIFEGAVDIRNGFLKNVNFIKSILSGIDSMPGLESILTGEHPIEYLPLLRGNDSPFEIFRCDFQVFKERIHIWETLLKHRHYMLEAEGNFEGFRGDIDIKGVLVLLEPLTRYLSAKYPSLVPLTNSYDRIAMPFISSGVMPGITARPHLNYVTQKIVQFETDEKRPADADAQKISGENL